MTTRAVKRGIRSHKLKPYRAAAAAEKKAAKANADFLYQKFYPVSAFHTDVFFLHLIDFSMYGGVQFLRRTG